MLSRLSHLRVRKTKKKKGFRLSTDVHKHQQRMTNRDVWCLKTMLLFFFNGSALPAWLTGSRFDLFMSSTPSDAKKKLLTLGWQALNALGSRQTRKWDTRARTLLSFHRSLTTSFGIRWRDRFWTRGDWRSPRLSHPDTREMTPNENEKKTATLKMYPPTRTARIPLRWCTSTGSCPSERTSTSSIYEKSNLWRPSCATASLRSRLGQAPCRKRGGGSGWLNFGLERHGGGKCCMRAVMGSWKKKKSTK